MMRNPDTADGLKADIYSFAKTIWMLLSFDEFGFEGKYDYLDSHISLRNIKWLRNEYLVDLELLLSESTRHDPDNRPSCEKFLNIVEKWIEFANDELLSQENEWQFLNRILFGDRMPKSASWDDKGEIIDILNIMATLPAFNHMLFSDIGGSDLYSAEEATEDGWIDLVTDLGSRYRVKPEQLYLENFRDNISWNYILLKFEDTEPIFKSTELTDEHDVTDKIEEDEANQGERQAKSADSVRIQPCEILTEDKPGHYVDGIDSVYGVYDYDTGVPLPKSARNLIRYNHGALLFVMKFGLYNAISATYDGRHGDCTNIQFRAYIEHLIEIAEYVEKIGGDPERVLNDRQFSKNPFRDEIRETEEQREHRREENKKKSVLKKYIMEKIECWSFNIKEKNVSKATSKIVYAFKYATDTLSLSDYLRDPEKNNKLYLTRDLVVCNTSIDQAFLLDDRIKAGELLEKLQNSVLDYCKEDGLEIPESVSDVFSIEIHRGDISPTHLFTIDEIRNLMVSADDRKNNVLVIDEDGYARIVEYNKDVFLYPVRLETWNARNNCVGKYSTLPDLNGAYVRALNCWLRYLMTGKHSTTDYVPCDDVEDVISKIQKYM